MALAIYASCVVAMMAISGTYHLLNVGGTARAVVQHVDYFAIWFLIGGTFTAIHGVMCRGLWRRGLLTLIWTLAATGIVLQALWFRTFSGVPGLALYLGCGWVGLASIVKLSRLIGFRAVRPMLYGGLFFTVGAVLEALNRPVLIPNWIGPHEIFHFAVIVGVAIHWHFIRRLLLFHRAVASVDAPTPSLNQGALRLDGARTNV